MTQQLLASAGEVPPAEQVVLYGDFNCPWSLLASRRAELLAEDGLDVDFRATEHEPWRPRRFSDSSVRFECLREEMEKVLALLLPGEELPYSLAGFLPWTRAAVSGYAEAYAAGVPSRARQVLFEAFWLHGLDLGDARLVRTLLEDVTRSSASPSEPVREWGYAVDVTGGPVSSTAWRLVRRWAGEWQATGKAIVPVLVVDGAAPLFGVDAVEWLGTELVRRHLAVGPPSAPPTRPVRRGELASLSWVSQHGNRWARDYQRMHAQPLVPRSG